MSGLANKAWLRILLVALVPLLAIGALVWSTSGRGDKIDRIPAAVVNNDQIISGPQPMAAGRALAGALTQPSKPDQNLKWTLTDSADAKAGLENGTYYAVLTIPQDFSKSILSTGTDKPVQGKLTLVSNAAASVTVPYISQQVAATAANALGVQSTQGYLKNVYAGFNQIASSNQKAASSAASLADGTAQLSQGATQLSGGAGTLSGSLGQIASGAAQLQAGAASLAGGADDLQTGAASVAKGAASLHAGAVRLAASSTRLTRTSAGLAVASRKVDRGAGRLANTSDKLSRGDAALATAVGALASQCAAAGGSTAYCAAVTAVSTAATGLATASARVSDRAATLATSTGRMSSGNTKLARGTVKLSRAAADLASASGKLSKGAASVSSGATSVAQGADNLATSAGSLTSGTQQAAAAADSLADGAATLSSSADQVNQGAQQLSSGLANGAKQSPTYSSSQQQTLADVVSQPVLLTHSLKNDSHGNGWLLALVIALVLWLTAMLGALRRDVTVAARNGGVPVSSRRLVLVELLPGLGLALLEGVAVLVGLLVLRTSVASYLPLALLTLVAALTFTALAFCARSLFGRAGMPVLVLFLLVQAAALGNVVPLETAPALLRHLNGILPLTAYVDGASQLVSGGHAGSPVAALIVLVVWGLVAVLAAVMGVSRRRVVRTGQARALPVPQTVP